MPVCVHQNLMQDVKPKTKGCEECMKTGDEWVHLRMCKICGKVGCCNSSKNKHAQKHYQETGHQLIESLQPGENWCWCYVDHVYLY